MATYTLPDLPYDYAALEPHYLGEDLELHHDKHHAAYVKGANDTLESWPRPARRATSAPIVGLREDLAFHLSGHILHSLFWQNLSPRRRRQARRRAGGRHRRGLRHLRRLQGASSPRPPRPSQGSGWGVLAWEPLGKRLDGRAGLRPPGQHRHRHHPAAVLRHVGARLLPAVQEREGRLRQGALEHRQLGRRRRPLRRRQQGRDQGLSST